MPQEWCVGRFDIWGTFIGDLPPNPEVSAWTRWEPPTGRGSLRGWRDDSEGEKGCCLPGSERGRWGVTGGALNTTEASDQQEGAEAEENLGLKGAEDTDEGTLISSIQCADARG
jgi:hypothetical protein